MSTNYPSVVVTHTNQFKDVHYEKIELVNTCVKTNVNCLGSFVIPASSFYVIKNVYNKKFKYKMLAYSDTCAVHITCIANLS